MDERDKLLRKMVTRITRLSDEHGRLLKMYGDKVVKHAKLKRAFVALKKQRSS